MQIINNIPVWGSPDIETVNQMHEAMKFGGEFAALMGDHHIGYSVPIGGVIAYERSICINGVGFDIACGNKAVRLSVNADDTKSNINRTMNEINKHISFGIGRKNNERVEHELFDDPVWKEISVLRRLRDKAISQLGTVGSGNHYVDVFVDEIGRVWCGVHFGSRGLGHGIATHFIEACGGKDGMHAAPVILDEASDIGQQYIKCMELAGRYAYAGRDLVCSRVAKILNANILEEVHNHHNFAWKETHHEKNLWVVRKGATPNWPGAHSFVGGSMGDYSYIIEGLDTKEAVTSLYSTIHGAGRSMGRIQAKGKVNRKTGEIIKPGLVSKSDMDEWVKKFDVELRGAGVDESPHCYKRMDQVLQSHSATVRVIHKLKPIGVCMASDYEIDPYKD